KQGSMAIETAGLPEGWSVNLYAAQANRMHRLQFSRKANDVSESITLVKQSGNVQYLMNRSSNGQFIDNVMVIQRHPQPGQAADNTRPVTVRITVRDPKRIGVAQNSEIQQYDDFRDFVWEKNEEFERFMSDGVKMTGLWP